MAWNRIRGGTCASAAESQYTGLKWKQETGAARKSAITLGQTLGINVASLLRRAWMNPLWALLETLNGHKSGGNVLKCFTLVVADFSCQAPFKANTTDREGGWCCYGNSTLCRLFCRWRGRILLISSHKKLWKKGQIADNINVLLENILPYKVKNKLSIVNTEMLRLSIMCIDVVWGPLRQPEFIDFKSWHHLCFKEVETT